MRKNTNKVTLDNKEFIIVGVLFIDFEKSNLRQKIQTKNNHRFFGIPQFLL